MGYIAKVLVPCKPFQPSVMKHTSLLGLSKVMEKMKYCMNGPKSVGIIMIHVIDIFLREILQY